MSNPLSTLQVDHWYKAVLVLSATLLVVALTVPFQGVENPSVALVCLGGVLIGLGEWRNHPLQMSVAHTYTLTSYPRRMSLIGTVLDLVGASFVIYGAYKLVA